MKRLITRAKAARRRHVFFFANGRCENVVVRSHKLAAAFIIVVKKIDGKCPCGAGSFYCSKGGGVRERYYKEFVVRGVLREFWISVLGLF